MSPRVGQGWVAVHPPAISPCTSSLRRAQESTGNFPGALSWTRTPGRPGDEDLTFRFSTRRPRGCAVSPAPGRTNQAHPRPRTLDRCSRVNCEADVFHCFASMCLFGWWCLCGQPSGMVSLVLMVCRTGPARSRVSA